MTRTHPAVEMYSFRTPDPQRLAGFWAELMGLPLSGDDTGDTVFLDVAHEVAPYTWIFHREDDLASPEHNRIGLDVSIDDADEWAGVADRAEALGATRVSEHEESGVR